MKWIAVSYLFFFKCLFTWINSLLLPDTLTNGQSVHLDAENRPTLNYKGFVTQNTNGVWSVLCDDKIDFDTKGAEISGFVCINLAFKGYRFFNKTTLPTSKLDIARPTRQSFKHIRDEVELDAIRTRQMAREGISPVHDHSHNWLEFEPILGSTRGHPCRALFVECVPFATGQHIENIDAEDQSKILDFHPIIHPAKKPAVVVEPPKEKFENPVSIRFPWIAEIYVNGQMRGIGILLEHYWVLTTSLALDPIE